MSPEGIAEFASHNHIYYTFSMGEVADKISFKNERPYQDQIIVGNMKDYGEIVLGLGSGTEKEAAFRASTANRDFSQYLDILGISKEDLGKRVLDLGSGLQEKFSRQASKLGIEVVSLNPKLAFDDYDLSREMARRAIEGLPPHQGLSVAAFATHLPFKDNSFDSVVSVNAIPSYLPREFYGEAFSEMTRILKSAGKAFLAPIIISSKEETDYLKSILDKNPNISYSIEPRPIGPSTDSLRKMFNKITLTKK